MGLRSLLYGAHCLPIHTTMVFIAWWKLYGFPKHPLLWLSFLLHDIGYWNKSLMDDAEGERHPELGATILGLLGGEKWYNFVLYHSRFLARREGVPVSRLCIADKLAVALTPAWLYLPMVRLTGEIKEYKALAVQGKYQGENLGVGTDRIWFEGVVSFLTQWVMDHKSEAR